MGHARQSPSPSSKGESLPAKILIAGGVSAFVGGSLNPIDVTKILIQNQKGNGEIQYTGMLSAMSKIFREEGWRGLAKGLEASMLRELTYSSIRIGGYEPVRQLLALGSTNPADTSPAVKFSAALLTGGIGSALANPLDLVKTRFQAALPAQPAPYRSTFNAFSVIYSAQGIAGLYRGWAVTSARAAVLTSAQLGSYDSIKHNLLMNMFGIEDGVQLHFGAAMSAGIITTTAANPLDVIKTRYLSDRSGKYASVLDCVRSTYRAEGVRAFLKGWVPAYWRIGPHTLFTLLLIEEIRVFLGMSTI